ncbi:MAG: alginate export family protein [Planctomycetes bacterium]|nr:alginate export family protein [Planctomycetota bacterium]
MMTGPLKTCMGVFLGSALVLFNALPCSADSSSDLSEMQKELRALKAEVETLRSDLNTDKQEIKVQNEELLASKKEYSQLSEQVRGLRQADPGDVETLKDQIKREIGVVPNVYNDLSRKIRIGMNLRTRAEYARNFGQITTQAGAQFGPVSGLQNWQFSDGISSNQQSVVSNRVRLNIDADVHEHLRAFFQLQDSRFWGVEATGLGNTARLQGAGTGAGGAGQNTLDMHQGYLDIRKLFNYPVTMRIGRQEIIWGDHRMFGSFGWHNIANSWDAIRGMYDTEDYAAEAWAAITRHDPLLGNAVPPVPQRPGGGIRQRSNDHQVYASMFTFKKLVPDGTLQLMIMTDNDQREQALAGRSQLRGNQKIWNAGLRIAGKVGKAIDYSGEYHEQWGKLDQLNHRARAGYVAGGYTFHEVGWKPRAGLEFNWSPGSGHGPGDSRGEKSRTFWNFYPTNHKHYGYMDQMAWMNMKAVRGQIKVKPTKKLVAWADVWGFWLDNVHDSWYNAAQAQMRGYVQPSNPNARNPDSFLGTELDLTAKYKLYKNVGLQAGYSHFFNGDYIEDTAVQGSDPATAGVRRSYGDSDSDWGYMQVVVGF